MLFKNLAPHPLDFRFAGHHYEVAVGAGVEIPDRFREAVASRKLPLELIPGTEAAAAPTGREADAPPTGSPARLWYDRALEMRTAGMALERDLMAEREALGEARVEIEQLEGHLREAAAFSEQLEGHLREAAAFSEQLRIKLGIPSDASILGAIERLQEAATAPSALTSPPTDAAPPPAAKPTPPPKK